MSKIILINGIPRTVKTDNQDITMTMDDLYHFVLPVSYNTGVAKSCWTITVRDTTNTKTAVFVITAHIETNGLGVPTIVLKQNDFTSVDMDLMGIEADLEVNTTFVRAKIKGLPATNLNWSAIETSTDLVY